MAKNYFLADGEQTLTQVYRELLVWFKQKQYELNSQETPGMYLIQAKKANFLRTVFGLNLAFQVKIYWSNDPSFPQEFIIETSIGKWIANFAGAGIASIFTSGLTMLTAIGNVGWAFILENQMITYLQEQLALKTITKTDDIYNAPVSTVDTTATSSSSSSTTSPIREQLQEELRQLELAFKNNILSETEFRAKKADLERKLEEDEIDLLLEAKIAKLQEAFATGIINAEEYEEKVKDIEHSLRYQILKERKEKSKKIKIKQLKEALKNGILTETEYQQKLAELDRD